MTRRAVKKMDTHREDNNYLRCIFNDDGKIESYFKTFESFMDDDVLDLRGGYKCRSRCRKEVWRAGGCLYSETS
jgi:hypothetical protein